MQMAYGYAMPHGMQQARAHILPPHTSSALQPRMSVPADPLASNLLPQMSGMRPPMDEQQRGGYMYMQGGMRPQQGYPAGFVRRHHPARHRPARHRPARLL